MKTCSKCQETKQESEFYHDKTKVDGLATVCKSCRREYKRTYYATEHGHKMITECNRRYEQSEKGRANRRRYDTTPEAKAYQQAWGQTEKGRAAIHKSGAKYRRTEKGKATKKRYVDSDKGKAAAQRSLLKAQENMRFQARQKVQHAIQDGLIPPASTLLCFLADGSCEGRMEYHHSNYAVEHWMDVIPLCRKHHTIMHGLPYHNI